MQLSAAEEMLVIDNEEEFKRHGFCFAINHAGVPGDRISLAAVPVSKNTVFSEADVHELIAKMQHVGATHARPSKIAKMFASRACRMSIMFGKPLSTQEMTRVVRHLSELQHPWNCPHGRVTLRHLTPL